MSSNPGRLGDTGRGAYDFYVSNTTTTAAFVKHDFLHLGVAGKGFVAQTIALICDTSAEALEFSMDGTYVAGKILTADGLVTFRNKFCAGVWVRRAGGTNVAYRVFAW